MPQDSPLTRCAEFESWLCLGRGSASGSISIDKLLTVQFSPGQNLCVCKCSERQPFSDVGGALAVLNQTVLLIRSLVCVTLCVCVCAMTVSEPFWFGIEDDEDVALLEFLQR